VSGERQTSDASTAACCHLGSARNALAEYSFLNILFQPPRALALCASGRLYAVEAWVQAGRSLEVPHTLKKTPLDIAFATGFLSLIELMHIAQTENRRQLQECVAVIPPNRSASRRR
jgi:hypothetical protein